MHYDKQFATRVNDAWLSTLDRLVRVLSHSVKRERASVVRHSIERDASLWLDSPYYATKAKHVVFISNSGDIYYFSHERLVLNTARQKLPSKIVMKPEQQASLLARYQGAPDFAEKIRGHWMLNHFSAWVDSSKDLEKYRLLSASSDGGGIFSKHADLPINLGKDRAVYREKVCAIRSYAQMGGADSSEDRADLPVDVPTLEFEATLIVDLDLYSGTGKDLRQTADVDLEFRNKENAAFRYQHLDNAESPMVWRTGRVEADDSISRGQQKKSEGLVGEDFRLLREKTIRVIESSDYTGGGMVGIKPQDGIVPRLPRNFIFGIVRWENPYPFLDVCLTWNMRLLE